MVCGREALKCFCGELTGIGFLRKQTIFFSLLDMDFSKYSMGRFTNEANVAFCSQRNLDRYSMSH